MRRFARAVRARCPLCGDKRIWKSFGETVAACPTCAYRFEREEGYWVGALIVNIGVAIVLFVVIAVGGMAVTWPDVPWNGLLIASMVAMGTAAILFYPQSKTIWVWLDLMVHPYEGDERDWERR